MQDIRETTQLYKICSVTAPILGPIAPTLIDARAIELPEQRVDG